MARHKQKTQDISRGHASRFIEQVLEIAAAEDSSSHSTALALLIRAYNLQIPTKCHGEAHRPEVAGNIDHCMSCMPNWGTVRTPVKVK